MDNTDSENSNENSISYIDYDEKNIVADVNDISDIDEVVFDNIIPSSIKSDYLLTEIWKKQFQIVFSDYKNFSDVPKKEITPFTTYVCILRDQREAVTTIVNEGMYYESVENGKVLKKVHPAHKVAADSARMLIPYYNRYGLTDYDRKTNEKRYPSKSDDDADFRDIL